MVAFALPLPPGRLQFIDQNGAPLANGTVSYYEPGTLTPKTTWADFNRTSANDVSITLDELGSAVVFGSGRYRQILLDADGNQIEDEETDALTDRPYEAGFFWAGTSDASTVLGVWNFTQFIEFPTNWDDGDGIAAYGGVLVPPGSNITLDIVHVHEGTPSAIGAMLVSTGGVVTFTSSVSTPQFVPGDQMRWVTQSGGTAAAQGLSATMRGTVFQF